MSQSDDRIPLRRHAVSHLETYDVTGGWPRLDSEKDLWVPRPCGFQGAVLSRAYQVLHLPWYNPPMGVIIKDPDILGGAPVFRGTRVPIQALFDYLEGGETLEEFLEGFPTVSREAAVAALEEAKHLLLAHS